jgi:predicted nucleotidyltransferase
MPLASLTAKKIPLADLRPIVSSLTDHIAKTVPVERLFLIGSAVRDEYTEYSDLDFVVVVSDTCNASAAAAAIHLDRPLRSVPVDVMVYNASHFDAAAAVGGIPWEAVHQGLLLVDRTIAKTSG